jgi:zeta-carotene desaturase
MNAHRIGVVGGGLSGMAAAVALAEAGQPVTLLESKPFLGGRACSYFHPGAGEIIDNCQHVLLGCCTHLLDFYRRTGADAKLRWFDRFTYIAPGGKRGVLKPSALPAPLQTAPSFLSFPHLGWRDKLAIARALAALLPSLPPDDGGSFLEWLHRHGQTERAIRRFWEPVLIGALNDELDHLSVDTAALVLRDGFLKSRQASRMGVATVPLSELYEGVAAILEKNGGGVRTGCIVSGFERAEQGYRLRTGDGESLTFDALVLAVPFHKLGRLLPDGPEAEMLRPQLEGLQSAPITGIHLWFDRQVTELEHAVLLDRTIQWVFQKSSYQPRHAGEGSYLELVVSASRQMVEMSRGEVIELALRELAEFFPAVAAAKLRKSAVVKELRATFAPAPGSGAFRLTPQTPWPGVVLSGDWTQTGWPATMEGAVRGGYRSAASLAGMLGIDPPAEVGELPSGWLPGILQRSQDGSRGQM